MKCALPDYPELHHLVQAALGADRKPLLIGVDGADGCGKTSTASWLSWQFGMPAVHLDLYVIPDTSPLQFRTKELVHLIHRRIDEIRKPMVVEGIMLLAALSEIERKPDFLIFVDGEATGRLAPMIHAYWAQHQPRRNANFIVKGFNWREHLPPLE